jgi:tRNA(Arg) A34 adenosine deaminase TadA
MVNAFRKDRTEDLVNRPTHLWLSLRVDLPAWVSSICRFGEAYPTARDRMRLAIALSKENVLQETGGPFGAAIFTADDHVLVSVGVNRVEPLHNSTLHAEMVAIMLAEQAVSSHTLNAADLQPHELYSSCSPCAMCLGAVLWSGVRRVTWSANRDDAMQIGFDEGPVFPQSHEYLTSRGIDLVEGLMRDEANEVLQLYSKRNGLIYNG